MENFGLCPVQSPSPMFLARPSPRKSEWLLDWMRNCWYDICCTLAPQKAPRVSQQLLCDFWWFNFNIVSRVMVIKCNFFQVALVSVLLYGCTTWMLTKSKEKNLDRNSTRMLWAILKANILQNSSCMATYLLSLKPSK